MKIVSPSLAGLLGLSALTALPAYAEPYRGLEAGLSIQHRELEIDAEGSAVDMDFSRISIAVWESAGPWLRLGLEGGPLRASQNDNPATAGMELSGQFIALSAAGRFLSTESLDLGLLLSYGYNRAEGDEAGQETRLTWHEGRAELAATLKLFPVYLSGGGFAFLIDGDETASGTLTYTRDFEAAEHGGAFLTVDYWVDNTGRISLRGEAGGRQGFELQFSRQF